MLQETKIMDKIRENDLVLAPNEYTFLQDTTVGTIDVIVGPFKKSLAGTDQPMMYDTETQKFIRTEISKAIQTFPSVSEGSYVVLDNPSMEGGSPFPKTGTTNPTALLNHGKKINIQGPVSFPLWPGQIATVVEGHQLRSNQYLVVQIYNENEARNNWSQAVMQPVDGDTTKTKMQTIPTFTTGQLLIIKGTEVAFYIPPTGVEVLTNNNGNYVRDAVTLERLEYCMLLDESGEKRYVEGPEVVFPEPTETFVQKKNNLKFKAIELTPHKGIYIKVIADYADHKAGEELFITGKDQKIYFPRAEHAIIKYDNKTVHYAIAIPTGEARYVLNRDSGEIDTIKGPAMFLPDPRTEVVVRRVLSDTQCELWFPGNTDAREHNQTLREETSPGEDFVRERSFEKTRGYETEALYSATPNVKLGMNLQRAAAADFGDKITRKNKFTEPRSITLDTKFSGAVVINVWPGYAVQVVNKTGERKIVTGPAGFALDYDQTLEVMEMSTGTPKTDEDLLRTVYLRVKNNRISDEVEFVTKDGIDVSMPVNFNVHFDGDSTTWFSVENYIKFLTQNLRSIIRNVMKTHGIDEVNQDAINIIRDAILGKSKNGKRAGRTYKDNGMIVYDVESAGIQIDDNEVSKLLSKAQREVVKQSLDIAEKQRELTITTQKEKIIRRIAKEKAKTVTAQVGINTISAKETLDFMASELDHANTLALDKLKNRADQNKQTKAIEKFNNEATLALQTTFDKINTAKTMRSTESTTAQLKALREEHEIDTTAYTTKLGAIQAGLIEAIISAGKSEMLSEFIKNMPAANGEIGHLFGIGGLNGLQKAIAGTGLETALNFDTNGGVEQEVIEK